MASGHCRVLGRFLPSFQVDWRLVVVVDEFYGASPWLRHCDAVLIVVLRLYQGSYEVLRRSANTRGDVFACGARLHSVCVKVEFPGRSRTGDEVDRSCCRNYGVPVVVKQGQWQCERAGRRWAGWVRQAAQVSAKAAAESDARERTTAAVGLGEQEVQIPEWGRAADPKDEKDGLERA